MSKKPENWTPEQAKEGAAKIDAVLDEMGAKDVTDEAMREERDVTTFTFRPKGKE